MAETTGIAWTRSTFNPWIGCTEVSPGCDGCYARELDKRHRYGGTTHWGAGVARFHTGERYWEQPEKWERLARLERDTRTLADSSSWHTPGFWPVFPSMCDPFDNEVPEELRAKFFSVVRATPSLTWLLLTKRIGNAMRMLPWVSREDPWQNVWVGASVVNQEETDRDIPKLLATPAAKRFISYEPALGPVKWPGFESGKSWCPICKAIVDDGLGTMHEDRHGVSLADPFDANRHCSSVYDLIHQIIVGGESNQGKHKARPFNIEWARSTQRQCRAAAVSFFMKQTGSDHALLYERVQKDRAGANPSEWPEDIRVQEFPA